ncbi:putative ankyrin repeat domain-containing protein 26-like protein [Microcebus murinus]|uniref:putative ankyrin repeat domain-containing protein 26-like protein n=1 Tax=Microcebus murinus TaxID=30608 RepID=UPI003F6D915C
MSHSDARTRTCFNGATWLCLAVLGAAWLCLAICSCQLLEAEIFLEKEKKVVVRSGCLDSTGHLRRGISRGLGLGWEWAEAPPKPAATTMKKTFSFGGDKGAPPSGPCSSWGKTRVGLEGQAGDSAFLQPCYHIRKKDLGKIHQAAGAGDVAKVEQVLSLKKKVLDARDRQKRTALHLACANGHPKVVTILVDRKCKLNVPDSKKRTALIKAVQCQEEECATILLEHGADPNHSDVYGNTALHYAVYHENTSITEKLLSHGANIEAINKFAVLQDHLTPLLLAISGKKEEMIDFLVKKNANVNAVDKMKRSALVLAAHCKSPSTVTLLLEQDLDVFSEDIFGWTAKDYPTASGLNM